MVGLLTAPRIPDGLADVRFGTISAMLTELTDGEVALGFSQGSLVEKAPGENRHQDNTDQGDHQVRQHQARI